jgi:hypothetical protein
MSDFVLKINEGCANEAERLCKAGKTSIKGKSPKRAGTGTKYRNSYKVIPYRDILEGYGCKLWNKQYQLSHLLEDGHSVHNQWVKEGGYTIHHRFTTGPNPKVDSNKKTSYYKMWESTEEELVNEYTSAVLSVIDKAFK